VDAVFDRVEIAHVVNEDDVAQLSHQGRQPKPIQT
jgi:hypothetical protein